MRAGSGGFVPADSERDEERARHARLSELVGAARRLSGAECAAYLESALPDEEMSVPRQEWFDVRVIPFQIGKQTRVLSQSVD